MGDGGIGVESKGGVGSNHRPQGRRPPPRYLAPPTRGGNHPVASSLGYSRPGRFARSPPSVVRRATTTTTPAVRGVNTAPRPVPSGAVELNKDVLIMQDEEEGRTERIFTLPHYHTVKEPSSRRLSVRTDISPSATTPAGPQPHNTVHHDTPTFQTHFD